jgi:hypothetical protein
MRRFSVAGRSAGGRLTGCCAGGCWGAVLVAIAMASDGDGRRGFKGGFTSRCPYVVT